MRASLGIFGILFLLGISPSQGQDTLTVMSYNIYHAENPETFESTLQGIANFIITIHPDFVALQEVDNGTSRLAKINDGNCFSLADSLGRLTSMHAYFGTAINFDGGEYGVAILSGKPFESQTRRLVNPQKGESRVLHYLEARTRSGRNIIFANTHLDHQFQENREFQAGMVNEFLNKQDKPVILAGDFNFVPASKEYDLMKSNWIDAAAVAGKNPVPTYPSEDPTERIDYIFLSSDQNWQVIDFQVFDQTDSDHRPIVATVVIKGRS